MRTTRRAILGTAAASITLSGCIGDDGGTTPTDSPTDTGMDDTPSDGDTSGPAVQIRSHPDHGDVLVGPDGMTLYMFDQDEQGSEASACSGDCLDNWPPLTVDGSPEAGDGVDAELSTFEREDGSMQVAANGWPLYYFAADEEPGDASGQGVGDIWWVLDASGEPIKSGADDSDDGGDESSDTVQVSSHPDHGDILVGPDEMTLYMFDQDEQDSGASSCSGDCLDNWPALTVEDSPTAADGVAAELSTFERDDGSMQVAANGWPLYYFAADEEPGDTSGQGVGDIWWVLDPEGVPIKPGETETTESGGMNYGY